MIADRRRMLLDRHPRTLERFCKEIDEIVDFVGAHGVSVLERLATAVYLLKRQPAADDKALETELRVVKPHITPEKAADAITRARWFLAATRS